MGWKKLVVVVSCSLLLGSCYNYYWDPRGSYRPKRNQFKLGKEPFQLPANSQLIQAQFIFIIMNWTMNRGTIAIVFSLMENV